MATDYNEEFEVDYFDKTVIDEKTLDSIIEKHLNENDEYADEKVGNDSEGEYTYSITYQLTDEESSEMGDYKDQGFEVEPTDTDLEELKKIVRDYGFHSEGGTRWMVTLDPVRNYENGEDTYYNLHVQKNGQDLTSAEYKEIENQVYGTGGNDSEDYNEDDLNAIDDGTPDPDDVGDFDEDYTDGEIDMMIADEIRDGKRMGVISNYNYTDESDTDIQWKLTFKGGEATEDDYEEIADAVENGSATGVTSMSGVTWSVEFPGESEIGTDEVKLELPPVTESVDRYSGKPRLDFENDINEYIEEIAQDYIDRFSPDVDYDADEDTIVAMEDAQYEFRRKIEQLKSDAWREVKHQVIAAENLSLDIDRVFEAAFSSKPALPNSNALGEAVEVKFPLTTEDEVKEAIKNFAKCEVEKQAALAKKIVKAAKKFGIKVAAKVMKALNESDDVSSEDDLIDHINELVDLMKKNNIESNIITFYKQGIVSTGYNNIDSFYGMAKTINGLNVKRLNNRQIELSIV
jgi:hypothetical protein